MGHMDQKGVKRRKGSVKRRRVLSQKEDERTQVARKLAPFRAPCGPRAERASWTQS